MAKAVFKAREFTVKAKGSKEFVSEEMVRAKLFAARKKKEAEMLCGAISPTKKPDVDNIAKSILDAMNNFVFKDDNQVSKISVEKRFALEEKAVIEVEEY